MLAPASSHPMHLARPEDHPLWGLQVELERGMLREGADRLRDRVVEAESRGQMTRLAPVRGVLTDWLPKVAEGLRLWLRAMDNSRGPKPIALAYLQGQDPHVLGMIALREILDGMCDDRREYTGLACAIGRTVEHELQVRQWEAEEPALFRSVQKHLKRTEATAHQRRVVNINRFNALLAAGKFGFGWERWREEVHFHVGVALINAVMMATHWFEPRPDPGHVFKKGRKHGPKLILAAKPGLLEWLGKQLDAAEVSLPAFMPTVIPPRRWDGTRAGGYWTPYVKTPRLIRFKASQEEQRDRAADEYDALDMPQVYDAIHFLQEVPWRVNDRVFKVAEEAITRDLGIAGLPLARELEAPPRPADIDTNETAQRTWKRAASAAIRKNLKRLSQLRGTARTLRIAKQYRDFQQFYFPHMMDFRGRMYPIPVGLQPQGDDLARGLLEFAEGKRVTEETGAAGWLAVQLASMWGNDKVSFDDRIAWVNEREDLWRSIAADPLGTLDWASSDKPWQALAAVFEWVSFLDHGWGYVSHIPVVVDGTCNGIQHLSAMTRDRVAGEYVNLVPAEKPQDIYKFVARSLQDTLERIEAGGDPGGYAGYWLDLCHRELPRTLTKRQVMVLPYGGTKDSFFDYTRQWLDEHSPMPDDASEEDRAERSRRLSFLVLNLWDTVNSVVSGAMVVMKWLQLCAKKTARSNQPIFWVTPAGFVVRHFYGKQRERHVTIMLDGAKTSVALPQTTKDLDATSQLRGIPPNFTHSLDAAALTISINRAAEYGISAFTAVHDAYGTHATDMWQLFGHLRAAFVQVHETDVLSQFRAACQAVLTAVLVDEEGLDPLEASERADEQLPALPPMGDLDLRMVLESDYFFA